MGHIVNLKQYCYSYLVMSEQLMELSQKYRFLEINSIGRSVMGRSIYMVHIGCSSRRIHINASHHANEWITTYILMKSIEKLCEEIDRNQMSLEEINFDFIPMVNPDGVELCLHGLEMIMTEKQKEKLIKMNEGVNNFSRWKANIRGVDLNRNYDAGFLKYKRISDKKSPSYAHYAGSMPESEPESKALAEFTRKRLYDMVIAYHTQGEVIYWNYMNVDVPTAKEYAIMFSEVSGYRLDVPDELAASGGYKDWFIETYHKPGFTIECGIGENPISVSQIENIMKCTWPIIKCAQRNIRKGVN